MFRPLAVRGKEIDPADGFHREIQAFRVFSQLVQANQVWMAQLLKDPVLAFESDIELWSVGDQPLQGDGLLTFGVVDKENGTHATAAKLRDEVVTLGQHHVILDGQDRIPFRMPTLATGAHGWRRFPFWYTVLALSEMDADEAKTELKYAAPELERTAARPVASAVYARRRQQLATRTLNSL